MVVLIAISSSIEICVQLNSSLELVSALKSLTPHVMEVVTSRPEVAEAVEEVDVVVSKTRVIVSTSTRSTTKSLQDCSMMSVLRETMI